MRVVEAIKALNAKGYDVEKY